jgi:hypothetical protein
VFGGKEIIEVSRTVRGWWWSLSLYSSILVTFGQLRLSFLICLVFLIFFSSLSFYLDISCVFELRFSLFNDILITYKKRKVFVVCTLEHLMFSSAIKTIKLFWVFESSILSDDIYIIIFLIK